MKNNNLLFGSFLFLSFSVLPPFEPVQYPQIHHLKCIGGTGDEYILSTIKLADGNYLSCGFTNSRDGDFRGFHNYGGYDAFLIKTGGDGTIIWKNIYGGSHQEVFYNIIETATGDILAIGTSGSNDRQVTRHHGRPGTDDIWLAEINSSGKLLKERCYGGSGSESTFELGMSEGLMIDKTGNILFAGETNSTDGDLSLSTIDNHGDYDGWVVKVDPATLNIIKSTTVGDAAYDALYNIHEINGCIFVTGTKSTIAYTSPGVDVESSYKAFTAKLNASTFDIIWYKKYGGSGSDDCNASVISQEGKLVLTGHAASTDGDCIGNLGFTTWTWKINPDNGEIIWQNFTGSPKDTSAAFNLIATRDGSFVAIGATGHPHDFFDAYAVKIDPNGNTLWTKRFGGSGNDQVLGGVEGNDGNILLGGLTNSADGDVIGYHSEPVVSQKNVPSPKDNGISHKKSLTKDAWLVELSPQ